MSSLPSRARAVVIGAGIVGNSITYHLGRLGWTDLVMLDKGPLPNPGGSTGHASNFIFPVDHSKEMTALTLDSVRQYQEMDVFTQSGGIEVARTEERMQELQRRMSSAKAWGIEPASIITPAEVKQLVPYIDESVILGGFYVPSVGVVDSLRAGTIMRETYQKSGALHVSANTEVLGIDVERGRVRRVRTTRGDIETEVIVVACGIWSPRIARMAGACIPLTPAVHQMIDVGPVPRFANAQKHIEYPIVRDMDTNMYERQDGSGLEIGSYAHRPILHDPDEIPSIEESALSPTEASLLFAQVGRLRDEGRGVVFVSHRLAEVERIADRVAVLRDGRVVATRGAGLLGRDEIVRLMVGRDIAHRETRQVTPYRGSALRAVGLTGRGFHDVSLEVRCGEIVGLAGLMGAGRTDLLRALFGATPPTAGVVHVGDAPTPASIEAPRDAVRLGIGLLTEDRKADGLLLPLSVAANITLADLRSLAGPLGIVDPRGEASVAARLIDALSIRCRSADQPVSELSGGNQQKALLARWLYRDSNVLLVDEPTRGIDVGAKERVLEILRSLNRERGITLLVTSSELAELRAFCDRIAIVYRGRIETILPPDADDERFGLAMAGELDDGSPLG